MPKDHPSIFVGDLGVTVAALFVAREKPQAEIARGHDGSINERVVEPYRRGKSPDCRASIKTVNVCSIGTLNPVGFVVRKVTECPCPCEVFHGP